MNEYEQYQQLKKYTPSNPKVLINQSESVTSSVRDEIMLKQRILCLLPLNHPQNYPKFFPENRKLFIKHISQNIEILRDTISPQQVQFISKVYNFFYENPNELVNVILSIVKKDESLLSFIVYSTIPSFFGYFSCIEHLSIAFSFYCALITKAPKHIIELLLRPFFCNSTTFCFIEALSSDVIIFFCQDVRLLNKNKSNFNTVVKEYSISFLNAIINNLKFLPNVHLNILQFMINLQWTRVSVFQLFLSSFIVPQIVSFLSISNSSFSIYLDEFFHMINHLNLNVTEEQLKPFFHGKSIYEIPSAFKDFGLLYVNFLTTPLDASIFFEAARPIVKFPKLIIMLQSEKYLGRQQLYSPIWIKVFPRAPKPILYSDSWQNLIFNFDNKKSHQNFENSNKTEDSNLNSSSQFNSNSNSNPINQIKKPKMKIPHFKRQLAMIRMISKEMNVDIFDIIYGRVACQTTDIIQSKLTEKSIDLTDICESCCQILIDKPIENVEMDKLCDKCRDLVLHKKERITFIEYAIKMELSKLKKQAILFEKLLLFQFSLNRLKKWHENVNSCYDHKFLEMIEKVIFMFFANNQIRPIMQRKNSPKEILIDFIQFIDMKKSYQFFYSLRSEKLLNFFLSNSNQFALKIKQLDQKWSKERCNLISENSNFQTNKIFLYSKSSVFYQIFSSITNMMNMISMIPFHRRYFLIIECLTQFNELKIVTKSDSSLLDFLKFSNDSSFLLSVIEISALLMKSPDFLGFCSKEETLLWYKMENELQKALSYSPKLVQLYNELHDYILQLVCSTV